MRIGGVRRDSQLGERLGCFEAVEFGDENKIGMEGRDDFQAGINRVADFRFFLRVGRIVAVGGVADEAILQAKRVNGFRGAGRQGNDAPNRLRNANGAAEFIDYLVEGRRLGG